MSRARNRADANAPDDSITSADLAPDIALTGGSVGIPSVSTANLPGTGGGTYASQTATNGMLVYNSTLGMLQQRATGVWSGITTAPIITSFQYSDGASATAEKTVVGLVSVSCTTQTSTTVLVPGASLGIQVGMVVAGTGIPVGATVVSVIEDTSFVLSAAATASATVTLTFGGAVTITGTGFDSILGGSLANIAVTFDGTSATSISVNSLKTIITCTPPAHAAGTITLKITNDSGLAATTSFIYDIEPIFTTAAGSLGSFVDGTYTANASAPRIQGTENSVALTTGFQRVTSATDDTVITTAIQGLTVLTSGYLTGTLSASEGTTYPFYATAMDNENQRTAPRLFNIISKFPDPTGGTIIEPAAYTGDFRSHTFLTSAASPFVVSVTKTVDILLVAGGGGGGFGSFGGGGGAGGIRIVPSVSMPAGTYVITVGTGGQGAQEGSWTNQISVQGANSTIVRSGWTGGDSSGTTITATGGGFGGSEDTAPGGAGQIAGGDGGSGGGGNATGNAAGGDGIDTSGSFGSITNQGNNGAAGSSSGSVGGGGGGGTTAAGSAGGDGFANLYRTGVNINYGGGGGGSHQGGASSGQGGNGGGGDGPSDTSGTGGVAHGEAGTDGLGGGGGGAGEGSKGGTGGSGIVVIRYAV